MDATLGASTTHGYLLLLPANSTTFFSPLLAALLAVTSLLWLVPGGPAWALSRCRRPRPARRRARRARRPAAHRALAAMSRSVPGGAALASFSVGLTRFVVASRPDTARELLSSAAFADRP